VALDRVWKFGEKREFSEEGRTLLLCFSNFFTLWELVPAFLLGRWRAVGEYPRSIF